METLRLLEKLTQHHGVAGDEKPIADLLEEEISDLGPVRRMLFWKPTWTKSV